MSKYSQGGVLAIIYNVWISGTKLGIKKKQCIKSIDIKETVVGSDVATLNLADPEFLYIEDNIFLEDNKIKIELGWDNTTYRVVFDGYISVIDINFGSDGIPTLTVTCMDNTHVMNREKRNETYKNCTSADVVKKLVRKYGFQCVIDSSYTFTKQETITQSNQTDIDFITKLAGDETYPFTARLVGNTFYYVKMGKLETPTMELTYKKYPHEIISFEPRIVKETRQDKFNKSSISTGDKSTSDTTGSSNNSRQGSSTPNGSSSSDSASGGYTHNPNSYEYDPVSKKWKKR